MGGPVPLDRLEMSCGFVATAAAIRFSEAPDRPARMNRPSDIIRHQDDLGGILYHQGNEGWMPVKVREVAAAVTGAGLLANHQRRERCQAAATARLRREPSCFRQRRRAVAGRREGDGGGAIPNAGFWERWAR